MLPGGADSSSGGDGSKQCHLDNSQECGRIRSRSLPTVIIPDDDDGDNDVEVDDDNGVADEASTPLSTGVFLPSLTDSSDDRRHQEGSRNISSSEHEQQVLPETQQTNFISTSFH